MWCLLKKSWGQSSAVFRLFRHNTEMTVTCRGSSLDISACAGVQLRPRVGKDNQTGEKISCSLKVCITFIYCLKTTKGESGRSQGDNRLVTKAIHEYT